MSIIEQYLSIQLFKSNCIKMQFDLIINQSGGMLDFYLTTSQQYIAADYAPTNRAKCKHCKSTIKMDQLKIGQMIDSDHFSGKNWYHLDCYSLKPRFKHIDPESQIKGLEKLQKKDQTNVLRHFKNEVKRLASSRKSSSKSLKKDVKKGKDSRLKSAEKQKKEKSTKKERRSQSKPNLAKKLKETLAIPRRVTRMHSDIDWVDDEAPKASQRSTQKSVKVKVKKAITKKTPSRKSEIKKSQPKRSESKKPIKRKSEQKKNIAKKSETEKHMTKRSVSKRVERKSAGKVKKAKKAHVFVGYTAEQQVEFKKLVNQYMQKTAAELKEQLGKNMQTKGGNKIQQAERCADGKILGQIPKCKSCGGGRPKFNAKTGIYTCPGYRDDVNFVNCHKTFTMEEIKRAPWID